MCSVPAGLGKHTSKSPSQGTWYREFGIADPRAHHDKGTSNQANEETVVQILHAVITRQSWPYFQNAPIFVLQRQLPGMMDRERKKRHATTAHCWVGMEP